MYTDRLDSYRQLEEKRNSKLLVFVTGDRPMLETQIAKDILGVFVDHLDKMGDTEKISLLLYTQGGDTMAAWSLINLIRQFCNDFEVIVPFKCHSSGTLISLGANRIVMTKQATLGPIDPSITGPLNPTINLGGIDQRIPVSVESVSSYLEIAKEELNIPSTELGVVLNHLSQKVHPLVLGDIYRTKKQIQMVASKLLEHHEEIAPENKSDIINFLCSESGSHDYTLNRKEASALGLNIEKPDQDLYNIIKQIYDDIEDELELTSKFDGTMKLVESEGKPVNYALRRGLIESVNDGQQNHVFTTEGILSLSSTGAPQDNRTFEGWRFRS